MNMKKILLRPLISLAVALIFTSALSFAAAPQQPSTSAVHQKTATTQPTATPPQTSSATSNFIPPAPAIDAAAYILMDANSGKILAQKDSNTTREPASLTKLMTLYVTFNAINQGLIKSDDKVLISKKAWKTGGSKMFVKAGNRVPIDKLIQGVIVDSGNDASMALAEYVGGSEQGFVTMMNQQAKKLGMNNTHFTDPTGLPSADHVTTASDLAILTRALITHFPQQYHYFGQKWLTYSGIRQPNRNRLLWRYPGADGLKTGHTNAAGFCLIASAQHNGMRLISVVMGAPSDEARSNDSITLLRYGFRFFDSYRLYQANSAITELRVWNGKSHKVPVGFAKDFVITIPHGQLKQIKIVLQPLQLKAPVKQGQKAGEITVTLNNETLLQAPVIALKADAKGGVFRRMMDGIHHKVSSNKSGKPITLALPQNISAPNPLVTTTTATTNDQPPPTHAKS